MGVAQGSKMRAAERGSAPRAAHRARRVSTRLHTDITAAANGMWAGLVP